MDDVPAEAVTGDYSITVKDGDVDRHRDLMLSVRACSSAYEAGFVHGVTREIRHTWAAFKPMRCWYVEGYVDGRAFSCAMIPVEPPDQPPPAADTSDPRSAPQEGR